MQLVSNAILRDSDVTEILNAGNANAVDSLYICDIIRAGLKESSYVQHAYLICEKSGNIYSDQGLFSGSSLPVLLQKIGSSEAELYAGDPEGDFHMLNENGLAPYCIFQIRDSDGNFMGALVVTLQMSEFLRIFYSLDAELCAVFNQDVYVASYITNIRADNFDWHDEASISALLGKPVTCKYIEAEDYTYMVAVSRESYNRPLHVIIKWFFIYAAAALILGYVYLYHVSKKRYQHIAAMIDALPVSYTGDQSYEHIYENIRKSLEDYRTQREHLQLADREHALHALLAVGGERPLTAEQFQEVGVDPSRRFYYVATFFSTKLMDSAMETDRARGETGFLHMLFRSTIHELAEQSHISYAFCGIPRVNVAILYGDDETVLRETVPVLSENVIEILTNSYSMSIQATISDPVTSVLELPAAYQETQRLHGFAKSINSNAAVISQEKLTQSSGVLLSGDFVRQKQVLVNTILMRKYDMVPAMMESILAAHVSPLRKNYALAQNRLQSIANELAEGVRMSSLPSTEAEQYAVAISQADSVQQLLVLTQQVFGHLAESSQETAGKPDVVTTACDYIARNLSDQNLNVAAICEASGVSAQWLTRMFQTQFGMAVGEYVNTCRIKLSKELLHNQQLTVAQIAQQVGYSNADTFTRNFKKIEGITASEYRKTLPDR